MGNYYGELAEGELITRYDGMRNTRNAFMRTTKDSILHPRHTNKSKIAAEFVSTRGFDVEKKSMLMRGGENLFKMKKFKNVEARTNTHNKRPQTCKPGSKRLQ